MSTPELVRQHFSDSAVTEISSALAEPSQRVRAAISAAVPVLLRMYSKKASHPDGSELLLDATHERGSATLNRFAESLDTRSVHELAETGRQQFGQLFSGESCEGLYQAISRFSGLGLASSRSLVGIVNSVTLATVGKHAGADDGQDLRAYLQQDQDAIEAAIPVGIFEYLDESPSLHDVSHRDYDRGASATGNDLAMENEEIGRAHV